MYKVELPAPKLSSVLDSFLKKNKIYFETELEQQLEGKNIPEEVFDLCLYCYTRGQEDVIEHIKRLEKNKYGEFGRIE